jgi:uncharacterized membrane protein
MVLGAVVMAVGLIELDERLGRELLANWPRLFGAGAEGSRGMLSAIATSMITVAGVTFSITVAALAQASSQYSPLILRNFMQDRANQVVLGAFGGIFVYCLIVLRSIRGGDEEFVPSIATFAALLHAVSGIGFLLFFIHHIATMLQASSILSAIAATTLQAIDRLFPHELGAPDPKRPNAEAAAATRTIQPVCPEQTGYIQSIRFATMLEIACKNDLFVQVEREVGDFAVADAAVASIRSTANAEDDVISAIRDCFIIGEYRTIEHDPAFGIRQIVDMAVKALSPGINDPTTACSCLEYLGAILIRLSSRHLEIDDLRKEESYRIATPQLTFRNLADLAFEQIRQNAKSDTVVFICLIDVAALVAEHTKCRERRRILLDHIDKIAARAMQVFELDSDRSRVAGKAAEVRRAIEAQDEAKVTAT